MCANSQLPGLTQLVKIILLSAWKESDGKDQRRKKSRGEKEWEKGKTNNGFFTEIIYNSGL